MIMECSFYVIEMLIKLVYYIYVFVRGKLDFFIQLLKLNPTNSLKLDVSNMTFWFSELIQFADC